MAHRDDTGAGPGANDNASGTAALLELARAYAPTTRATRVHQPYSLLFLSTDGAVYGGLGAAWFAAHAPEAPNVIAVVNLDAIAGPRPPRLELAGDTPRSPTAGLAETVRAQLAAETGARSAAHEHASAAHRPRLPVQPLRAGAVRDARDSGGHDHDGGRPAAQRACRTAAQRLRATRLGQIGRATQNVIDALQQGVALAPGPSSYIYLGSRIVRGWAVELVLVGALLPFLAATVDLFARCRRRRIRVAPALRSYRSRLGFWAWCGALFALFALLGVWPDGAPRPPSLDSVQLADGRTRRRSPCSPGSAGS